MKLIILLCLMLPLIIFAVTATNYPNYTLKYSITNDTTLNHIINGSDTNYGAAAQALPVNIASALIDMEGLGPWVYFIFTFIGFVIPIVVKSRNPALVFIVIFVVEIGVAVMFPPLVYLMLATILATCGGLVLTALYKVD